MFRRTVTVFFEPIRPSANELAGCQDGHLGHLHYGSPQVPPSLNDTQFVSPGKRVIAGRLRRNHFIGLLIK